VQYVSTLPNNQLWERAHDPVHGLIVRVNTSHRFFREYIQPHLENVDLVEAHDLLFFALARGEYKTVYGSEQSEEIIEKIMDEYRDRVGNELSDFVRSLEK
jgi:hypothetical protein